MDIQQIIGGKLVGAISGKTFDRLDPFTGEMHSITYQGDEFNKVWHVVVDKHARVIREVAIPVSDGPSIHDCAITENYVLVLDLPVTFSMSRLLAGHSFPYAWNEKHQARVGLLHLAVVHAPQKLPVARRGHPREARRLARVVDRLQAALAQPRLLFDRAVERAGVRRVRRARSHRVEPVLAVRVVAVQEKEEPAVFVLVEPGQGFVEVVLEAPAIT